MGRKRVEGWRMKSVDREGEGQRISGGVHGMRWGKWLGWMVSRIVRGGDWSKIRSRR